MAHGSPRIDVCRNCHQYKLVSRFSEDPNCPICGKKAAQTTESELKKEYNLSIFHEFNYNFERWTKLPITGRKAT